MPAITLYVPDHVSEALEAEARRVGDPKVTPTKIAARLVGVGLCEPEGGTLTSAVFERVRAFPGVSLGLGTIGEGLAVTASPEEVRAALDTLAALGRVRVVALAKGGQGWTLAA